VSSPGSVIVEADGGSRGNPGPAAYGALVRDARDGTVIAERAEAIGTASNNVAEYRGLLAGLELVREHAPDAAVEVRMDSKLVIEQMAGRWKIKHPDMRAIAMAASRVLPARVTWTWVPREQNKAADGLVNAALDAQLGKPAAASRALPIKDVDAGEAARVRNHMVASRPPDIGAPTAMLLLRHAGTDVTSSGRFSGSGGADPGLNDAGRDGADRAGRWLGSQAVDVIVSSPLRRARETAGIVADRLGLPVSVDDGVAEVAFGEWDGLTLADIRERYPDELEAWLTSVDAAPPGGESYTSLSRRVLAARMRLLLAHPGRRVLVVSHAAPIALLVRDALDAPLHVMHRIQVAPASLTAVTWWSDGASALQQLSYVPESWARDGKP
jgi:probable phosphoglycerate mutase